MAPSRIFDGEAMTVMNTAVSGMLGQNNWLSTIAQNVANAGTTGYKDAETQFASLVDNVGSLGAVAGMGVSTSSLTLAALQGSISATAVPTNLAIQGAGFFVVSNGSDQTYLTRAGSFVPDASGNLVNAAGYSLMAAPVQNGVPPAGAGSLGALQTVNVDQARTYVAPTTAGALAVNLPSTASIVPAASTPAGGGSTTTARTSLIAYDSAGAKVTLDLCMTRVADATPGTPTWEVDVYDAAKASPGGGPPYSAPALASQTLAFDPTTGKTAGPASLSVAIPNGQTMTLDMGASTQLASGFAVAAATTNGSPPTAMTGVNVSAYGALSFVYANGVSVPAYSIQLANVASPNSLTAIDGAMFSPNAQSGAPEVGTPGSLGLGAIQSGSLENSTVDLASQLTAMVQAQSDYGFNSQVFQTGSAILDTLDKL
jgi:flagellar hook protein FlgE